VLVEELVCANALKLMVIPAANNRLVFKISPSADDGLRCWFYRSSIKHRRSNDAAPTLVTFLPYALRSNVDPRKVVKESKDIQQPQNNGNDYDAVQN
jgi:hypothetical protein